MKIYNEVQKKSWDNVSGATSVFLKIICLPDREVSLQTAVMLQDIALPRMENVWKKKRNHTPHLTSLPTLCYIWCNLYKALDALGNLMYPNAKRAFFLHWHKWHCCTATFLHTVITFKDINCRYTCNTFFSLSARQELYNTVTTLPPRQPHKLGKTSCSNEGKDTEKKDNVGETEADTSTKGSWVKSSECKYK